MDYPPARQSNAQDCVVFPVEHPSVTANTFLRRFKASRPCIVERVWYYNQTGLAEHADNAFDVSVLNVSADALVVADQTFTAANATEIFTAVAHGLLTGDGPFQVSNSGGGLPTGLTAATDYYIIKIDADTFYLAASRALAYVGTAVAITCDGTGTQTISDTADTVRPIVVASGIDTDSDETGTNTLVADVFNALAVTAANRFLEKDEELAFLLREDGSATLPAGCFLVEIRYVSPQPAL